MSQPSPLERAKTAAQNIATAFDAGHTAVVIMSLASLNRALRELEEEQDVVAEMLMDAIEERHRVEDWLNPEKGITRIEACLNALVVRAYKEGE